MVDLTLFDHDGSLVEELEVPPALYAKLQPYIARAKAKCPPTSDEYLKTHGLKLGPINAPSNNRISCTLEISDRITERLEKLKAPNAAALHELWARLFINGLSLAERNQEIWDAINQAHNIATEISALFELMRSYMRCSNAEGQKPEEILGQMEVGVMRLAERLQASLTESLTAINKAVPYNLAA